jgi:TatD DNase family protein
MKFVDAHMHLSDEEYSNCVDEIVADAKESLVVAVVSNSMDLKTCIDNLKLAEKYPGMVYVALGVHPWNVQTITDDELQRIFNLIEEQKQNKALIAIGEIGLDHKYNKILEKQLSVFNEMLHIAEKSGLPVIIHSRGMTAEIVDMLPSYRLKRVLLHWFSNPLSVLPKTLERGYYITEGPPTVYSNGIREVIRKVPLANLLTETDGPVHFFKPPFNGKRTTPAFIPTVVRAIAEIKGLRMKDTAKQIMKNFEEFFIVKLN